MKNLYMKLISILVLSLALGACATLDNILKPRVSNLLVSPDFVPEKYYQGTFMLAPLSSTVSDVEFSNADARHFANSFQSYIQLKRPGMSVTSFDVITGEIGVANYQALTKEFQETGVVSSIRLRNLNEMHGIQYLVFTDLYDRNIEETWDEREDKDNNHYNVTAKTRQKIQVRFSVIDTMNGTTAWSGTLSKSSSDSEFYDRYPESQKNYGDASGALAVLDVLLGEDPRDRYDSAEKTSDYSDRFPTPQPENINVLMVEALEGFVLNLPKLEQEG